MHIAETIYTVGNHESSSIKGLKCALSLLGICNDFMAEPFRAFQSADRDLIRRRLAKLGLLPHQPKAVELRIDSESSSKELPMRKQQWSQVLQIESDSGSAEGTHR